MAKMTWQRYEEICKKARNRKDLTLAQRKSMIDKAYKQYSKELHQMQIRNYKKLLSTFKK